MYNVVHKDACATCEDKWNKGEDRVPWGSGALRARKVGAGRLCACRQPTGLVTCAFSRVRLNSVRGRLGLLDEVRSAQTVFGQEHDPLRRPLPGLRFPSVFFNDLTIATTRRPYLLLATLLPRTSHLAQSPVLDISGPQLRRPLTPR